MRKIILSSSVTVLFVAYIVYQHTGLSEGTPTENSQGVTASMADSTKDSATPTPTPTLIPTPKKTGPYNDGQYTGNTVETYYGLVKVRATILGGKLADVVFLEYPNDRSTSREINAQAMPYLRAEAIRAQSSNVDIISGATDTSEAFIQSLHSALGKAL